MLRLILAVPLFLLSLLTVLPIPASQAWYPAVAAGEFPLIWIAVALLLLALGIFRPRFRLAVLLLSGGALVLFTVPLIHAARIGSGLDKRLAAAFGSAAFPPAALQRSIPFTFGQMVTGAGGGEVPFTVHQYAPGGTEHALRFYPAQTSGPRPCLLVVHGGSWRSGSFAELGNVNSWYAKAGYAVASMNYRLAPGAKSPAPREDVHAALAWLRANAARLSIDTTAFVLMGRSAGGQIVLDAAYRLQEPGLRGVISFYGPTDMIYAYNDRHNKLVMDHQMVMRDYLGGSPAEVPAQYLDASPTLAVHAGTVPTLLVHGMLDEHVHYRESELLAEKLQAAGVPHLLLGLPWATHGCEYTLNGPSGQLAAYAGERFLYAVTQGSLKNR